MTIRVRLTLWYSGVLFVSLLLIGLGTYQELAEQMRHEHRREPAEDALGEAGEMIIRAGLPAVVLGMLGGWWFTRRALVPVTRLTDAVEKIHDRNLHEPLLRTGNGDELDRLMEVFNGMTARLDHSFQRIREFTLHASHELKTPLTIMHSELETALQDQTLSTAQREHLHSQLDEVRRLSNIVDGLTLLTKADAGQVPLACEPVRLDELVRDAVADAEILARPYEVQVTLAACDELTVDGDRHRLRQLLLNLTDNAIKYNQPKGSVTVALRGTDNAAELTITNTGLGISAEQLPEVFERFYRGDPAHSNVVEGCGLGLSIAQWIVSAHKGKIKIDSVPSHRTTVFVCLPRAAGRVTCG